MRRFFYWLARFLGDVNAISRGPRAMGKRVVRKAAYKTMGKTINRWLK